MMLDPDTTEQNWRFKGVKVMERSILVYFVQPRTVLDLDQHSQLLHIRQAAEHDWDELGEISHPSLSVPNYGRKQCRPTIRLSQ